jgi:hypothetical protein
MNRAVIYVRVSSREQAEGGYSIEAQLEACRRSFCRNCRCAWKTSTGQEYATAIHAPIHTLAPSDPPAGKRS